MAEIFPFKITPPLKSTNSSSAYIGLCTYVTPIVNYREQIGTQLTQPMVIGQKYFFSFYTVLGEGWAGLNLTGMPSNNIGLRFSTIAFNAVSPTAINNFAHLRSLSIITDSVNWQLISGSFVADSVYNYVILGNFFDDANTNTLNYGCGFCTNDVSYYLMDDICVSTDSLLCNGGINSLSCSFTGTDEVFSLNRVLIYPNPANDKLNISFPTVINAKLELRNLLGNLVFSEEINNKMDIAIETSNLNSGVYFLHVEEPNGINFIKKIIKP